jgi:hypothetical protein
VCALGRQPDVHTLLPLTINSYTGTAALYHRIISARTYKSTTFDQYTRKLYYDHREHRPHFFSTTDHTSIFILLFDADQIVGRYREDGHTPTTHRQLPRDWR